MIGADFSLVREYYSCGEWIELQHFIWEIDKDGESIRIVPPNGEGAPFQWGAVEILSLTIKPSEVCGEILITTMGTEPDNSPVTSSWAPGRLCAINSQQDACVFEFQWCEGPPPPPVCG